MNLKYINCTLLLSLLLSSAALPINSGYLIRKRKELAGVSWTTPPEKTELNLKISGPLKKKMQEMFNIRVESNILKTQDDVFLIRLFTPEYYNIELQQGRYFNYGHNSITRDRSIKDKEDLSPYENSLRRLRPMKNAHIMLKLPEDLQTKINYILSQPKVQIEPLNSELTIFKDNSGEYKILDKDLNLKGSFNLNLAGSDELTGSENITVNITRKKNEISRIKKDLMGYRAGASMDQSRIKKIQKKIDYFNKKANEAKEKLEIKKKELQELEAQQSN